MNAEVRAGLAESYAATVPAGQVGLWCGDSSDNSFDDFKLRDIAGPYEVDGRWFCDTAGVSVDASNSNVLKIASLHERESCVVRRGLRGDKYVATWRFKKDATITPGFVVRWVNPGDWLAVSLGARVQLQKRQDDGEVKGG